MAPATLFSCDHVEFSTTARVGPSGDEWHFVKISVQDVGLSNRWIYVEPKEAAAPPALPILNMALGEGWDLTTDERSKTLILRGQDVETLTTVTQKLRFKKVTDFWSFMFQLSLSRVRGYSGAAATSPRRGD